MKAIGCISKTEDDEKTLCTDCSFADDLAGNDSKGCKDFRKVIGGKLFYK
jgi:hypothetical protein